MDPGVLRDIAMAVYDKIAPALGQASNPAIAAAASAFTLATWLLLRRGRPAGGRLDEERELVRLYVEIQRSRRMLEESRGAGAPEEAVKALEDKLRWLEEEYNLLQVRIAARDSLEALGGRGLVERLDRVLEGLDRGGEEGMKGLFEVLREVEERWRRRQLEAQALRRLLDQRLF